MFRPLGFWFDFGIILFYLETVFFFFFFFFFFFLEISVFICLFFLLVTIK